MFAFHKINPMVRAIGTMVAVVGVASGVTFASLTTNTVALTANELDVTSDVLRISNGGAFSSTGVTGFTNSNLIVNTEGPKNAFYFQNLANAALTLSATVPGSPTVNHIATNGIHVKFYDKDGTTLLLSTTLQALEAGPVALGDQLDALAQGNGGVAGTEGNYFYSVSVDASAVTGSPASVPSFEIDFSGTTV
ncbi:MAG TPA: hypothetical protein VLF64_03055 [Candidatus Saccharimonadales bacterium]|nr:hypothetical protein [Candidatus Saccharimonadales bacterium]